MYLNSSCLLIVVSVRLARLHPLPFPPRRSLFLDDSSIVYSQAFGTREGLNRRMVEEQRESERKGKERMEKSR